MEGEFQVSGIHLLSRQGPRTQLSLERGTLSGVPQRPVPAPLRAITILLWQKPTYLPRSPSKAPGVRAVGVAL